MLTFDMVVTGIDDGLTAPWLFRDRAIPNIRPVELDKALLILSNYSMRWSAIKFDSSGQFRLFGFSGERGVGWQMRDLRLHGVASLTAFCFSRRPGAWITDLKA